MMTARAPAADGSTTDTTDCRVVFDADNRVLEIDTQAAHLTEVPSEQLVGRSLHGTCWDVGERIDRIHQRLDQARQQKATRYRNWGRTGTGWRCFEVTMGALPQGQVVCKLRDVTASRPEAAWLGAIDYGRCVFDLGPGYRTRPFDATGLDILRLKHQGLDDDAVAVQLGISRARSRFEHQRFISALLSSRARYKAHADQLPAVESLLRRSQLDLFLQANEDWLASPCSRAA